MDAEMISSWMLLLLGAVAFMAMPVIGCLGVREMWRAGDRWWARGFAAFVAYGWIACLLLIVADLTKEAVE